MQYFSNLQFTKHLASQIIKDRRCNYNQQHLIEYLQDNQSISERRLKVLNNKKHQLHCSIFKPKGKQHKTCILYLHGLGSNRLEVLSMLKVAGELPYDVCSFDFSGSGKSDGYYTTYGVNESEDINSMVAELGALGYTGVLMWGRSMGGVSAVLYYSRFRNPIIKGIVLDSPFCSFQQVARELASQRSIVPQFMINLCLQPLKKCLQQHYNMNPFQVNIEQKIKSIDCSLMLVYSKNDKIVNYQHSLKLIESCPKKPQSMEIEQDHNTMRSQETILKILAFFEKTMMAPVRTAQRSRSRGISLCSRDNSREGREQVSPRGTGSFRMKTLLTNPNDFNTDSAVLLPHRKSTIKSIKSINSVDLGARQNPRQFTSHTDLQFSPKLKDRNSKKLAFVTSILFESGRLPQSNKQNVRPNHVNSIRNRIPRKR